MAVTLPANALHSFWPISQSLALFLVRKDPVYAVGGCATNQLCQLLEGGTAQGRKKHGSVFSAALNYASDA